MKTLTKVTEEYKVGSESEVKELIEDAKAENNYTLTKYSSQYKEKKSKGEIIDTYYKVTLTKAFDEESAF